MGQNQVLDMGFPGNLPNHRRRHVQVPRNSHSTFRPRIMGHEQICVRRQARKTFTLTIRISNKCDRFAADFYPPCQGRNASMDDVHRIHGKIAATKCSYGLGGPLDVVRLHLVTASLSRYQQLTEVAIGAVLVSKEIGHKLGRRGHEVISHRAADGQGTFAIFKPGRLDQRRKIGAMVDVKVSEQNHIRVRHLRPALSESKSTSSPRIDDYSRSPVFPHEIAARGSLVLQLWPSGTKHLHRDTLRAAGLGLG